MSSPLSVARAVISGQLLNHPTPIKWMPAMGWATAVDETKLIHLGNVHYSKIKLGRGESDRTGGER